MGSFLLCCDAGAQSASRREKRYPPGWSPQDESDHANMLLRVMPGADISLLHRFVTQCRVVHHQVLRHSGKDRGRLDDARKFIFALAVWFRDTRGGDDGYHQYFKMFLQPLPEILKRFPGRLRKLCKTQKALLRCLQSSELQPFFDVITP